MKRCNIRSLKFILTNKIYVCIKLHIYMDMNSIFMFFKLFNIRSVKFILTNKFMYAQTYIYMDKNLCSSNYFIYFTINVYIDIKCNICS